MQWVIVFQSRLTAWAFLGPAVASSSFQQKELCAWPNVRAREAFLRLSSVRARTSHESPNGQAHLGYRMLASILGLAS